METIIIKKLGVAILVSDKRYFKMKYITKDVGNFRNTEGQSIREHNIPKYKYEWMNLLLIEFQKARKQILSELKEKIERSTIMVGV